MVITHSFSSLILLKTLPNVKGYVLCNPIPPSGNFRMTVRFLRRSLGKSYKIIKGLAFKKVCEDEGLARFCFFDEEMEDVEGWMDGFKRDSEYTIDLKDLSKNLPKKNRKDVPSFVIGSTGDNIVDEEAVAETREFLGGEMTMIDSAHDVMLGRRWEEGAYEILEWLKRKGL